MKRIRIGFFCAGLLTGAAAFAPAAATTMKGTISDSMCGSSHAKMKDAHKDAKMTDHDCTLACVNHGAKYVFISEGKVYQILNQNLPTLMKEAGEPVTVSGDVSGDSITISHVSLARHQ